MPFIARWPGRIKPGSTCGETVCLNDLMATCAAIVGEALPEDAGEDSYNMLPALLGSEPPEPIRKAKKELIFVLLFQMITIRMPSVTSAKIA